MKDIATQSEALALHNRFLARMQVQNATSFLVDADVGRAYWKVLRMKGFEKSSSKGDKFRVRKNKIVVTFSPQLDGSKAHILVRRVA